MHAVHTRVHSTSSGGIYFDLGSGHMCELLLVSFGL